jgi:hypothetical protein
MLKDMNLSTILLLAVVGFLIYCLMKPTAESFANEGFANEVQSKTMDREDSQSDDENNSEETQSEQQYETRSEAQSEPPSEAQSEVDYEEDQLQEMIPRSSLSNVTRVQTETDISPEMVNQILAESDRRMQVAESNTRSGSVYNYEANDEDIGAGASLDAAFSKPIPVGTDTEVVDLNRNNVKNYNAKDYLPKEVNDDWFNTDFSQAKYKMNDDKLINTERYVVGINTVGQSLKNASYDIRGAVNVPKYSVSPWNNSTIEPDYNIKPLC